MHDFVFGSRWNCSRRRWLRTLLKAHHHLDFGAKSFAVKLDGLFATAVEEQVGLYDSIVFGTHGFAIVCRVSVFATTSEEGNLAISQSTPARRLDG
jgi:hypothetical protein